MQYQYQMMNFRLTTCDTILQFSHQRMVALDNTEPVSTYCYQTCTHGRIVTLDILLLRQYQPSWTAEYKLIQIEVCSTLLLLLDWLPAGIYSNGDTS